MITFHTIVYPYENLAQATVRAAYDAVRNGYNSYSVDCEKCGQRVDMHEQSCESYVRSGAAIKRRILEMNP